MIAVAGMSVFALFIGLALLSTAFWVWMLIDCATMDSADSTDKIVWILVILFTHVLGAAIYFFVRRRRPPSVSRY